jgi:hypothetical protein
MKATIKVPMTTTKEVEVQLPQFRKDGDEYHAIYGEDSYDNIYFRIYKNKLICFMAFSDLNNVSKGVEITKEEFVKTFNEFKETMNINGVDKQYLTSEKEGEYYLSDDCSTKGEDGGDEGFNEFVKENYK